MTVTATATQTDADTATVEWTTDESPTYWDIFRNVDGAGFLYLASTITAGRSFVDSITGLPAIGGTVAYRVSANPAAGTDDTAPITWAATGTYGDLDPLETAARYTTVALVKERLRIPAANTTFDARVLEAVVAAEWAIDSELGRSFPDPVGGEIEGIPEAVKNAATSVAVSVYKFGDSPTGTAGSEDFIGALDVAEMARNAVSRSPVLKGFKVTWGLA